MSLVVVSSLLWFSMRPSTSMTSVQGGMSEAENRLAKHDGRCHFWHHRINRKQQPPPALANKQIITFWPCYASANPGLSLSFAVATAPIFGFRDKETVPGTTGDIKWISYGEFHDRFRSIARGFRGLGLQRGENVGIYSDNRLEWPLVEFATYYHGYISVAIYESMGQQAAEYVMSLTELTTVVTTPECAKKLLKMRDQVPLVKKLVMMETPTQDLVDKLTERGFSVFDMTDVEKYGRESPEVPFNPPMYDDVATIVFTSGTTDRPKGVILTHGNIVSTVAGTSFIMDQRDLKHMGRNDSSVTIIPLSHVLGRITMHMMIAFGCKTVFPRTAPEKMLEDINELKPTVFIGVPKFFNRMQDRMKNSLKSKNGVVSSLYKHAVKAKSRNIKHGQKGHWLWDHVVFNPISETLGGNIRVVISGTSSISQEAMSFLKCAFSCDVNEGYGMTETCGPISFTTHDDNAIGCVGTPFPTNMIKLVSVKELGYTVDDKPYPRGEIYVRGANVFHGYYRQPELTAEVLSPDGWFRTGDLGLFDNMGRLKIIDRICNIFRLSAGHTIEPERIEYTYCDSDIIKQAFVYGDREHSSLVAVVVPDAEFFRVFLQKRKFIKEGSNTPHEMLCIDPDIRVTVLAELNRHGKESGLMSHELLRNVYLEPYGFDVYNLLTPTLKIKRHDTTRHYQVAINRLYEEIGTINSYSRVGSMSSLSLKSYKTVY
ncbi:acetyl-CoA synthetase-like protein [Martensiomyces pterosporus]|nr:acetyl-CoA synthetase-like protein [Martensiomyces pterosporus]